VIVVGSPTSSNSNRLREVAENPGLPTKGNIGSTAGASAPEIVIQAIIDRLELGLSTVKVKDRVARGDVTALPKKLAE